VKILAWNIRQGGGSRSTDITEAIIRHQPDIAVLSEFRNNPAGQYIRTKLLTTGYFYQYPSHQDTRKNGVLIVSRTPCDFQSYHDEIKAFPEAVAVAKFEKLNIWGLYLPHKKKHQIFDFIISKLPDRSSHLLIGDFNTGKNFIDQKSDSFWYTDKLIELESLGYFDAFRYFHGQKSEFSWFSHQGNGYRYDHCYLSPDLKSRLLRCDYSHGEREQHLSDHSMLLVRLSPI